MAEMRTLYGHVIEDIIATGDKDLMSAVAKVSGHLLARIEAEHGDLHAWKNAHAELEKLVGG